MTLSQSVASELLGAFRAGEGVDLARESVLLVMQELIERPASRSAPAATNGLSPAPPNATAHDHGWWPPRPVASSYGSPSFARARSSPSSWNGAAASTRRCMRW